MSSGLVPKLLCLHLLIFHLPCSVFVLPEALYSPHSTAQNIVLLNNDPVFSWFYYSRVAVTPGSAAQAAAYLQRAINFLIWDDWSFPEAYDVRSLYWLGRNDDAPS